MPSTEPGRTDSFLMGIFRQSFLGQLPWKQVCRKAVLMPLLLVWFLYILYEMVGGMMNAYSTAVVEHWTTVDLLSRCGSIFLALSLVFVLTSLELIFIAVCLWQFVLWGKAVIAALPAIWAGICTAAVATWEFLGKIPPALGTAWRFLCGVPSAVYNSTARERALAVFVTVSVALFGVIGYFGWGTASYIGDMLSFSDSSAFSRVLLTVVIDMYGSMIVWTLVMGLFVTPLARWVALMLGANSNPPPNS